MPENASPEEPRPPTKFQIRREKTRADLLQLGIDRFLEKGYGETTIEDVVRGSGYTRGAFYFHFSSKEDFFIEVLRARRDRRGQWWKVVEAAHPATIVEALVAAQGEFARTDPQGSRWSMLISEFVDANRHTETLMAPLKELYQEWADELGILMSFIQDKGWCRTDLTPAQLASDILAITTGFGVMYDIYEADPSRLMDVYLRFLEPR